jgi:uncharacterized membrane protein YuzA (DUF378 family)
MPDLEPTLNYVSWFVAAVAAINWGTVEQFDINLLTEVGLSGSNLSMAYIVIGLLGAYNLYLLVDKLAEM